VMTEAISQNKNIIYHHCNAFDKELVSQFLNQCDEMHSVSHASYALTKIMKITIFLFCSGECVSL
jgi:hypothetical protein